jgi:hypothetical protein
VIAPARRLGKTGRGAALLRIKENPMNRNSPNPSRSRRLRAAIDALESRRMLADFFGTGLPDLVDIAATASVTLVRINNGAIQETTDTEVNIFAGAGNDIFRVTNTRNFVFTRLLGETDNDHCVNITPDLDLAFAGPTVFFGGSGSDKFVANNSGDTTPAASIDITRTGIERGTDGAIALFDEVEILEYRDNDNSNRISFTNIQDATREITSLEIGGAGGNDTITNFRPGDPFGTWSTAIGSGGVLVEGGSGSDTLLLSNHIGGSGNYALSSTVISATSTGSDAGPVTYGGVEAIEFDVTSSTGGGDDLVTVTSKPAGTSLSFDAGPGNDSFVVGGGDWSGNGFLQSNTTLLGGSGNDVVVFDDVSTLAGVTYVWNASSLARGTSGFNVSSFETRTLRAANIQSVAGPNTVNLEASASGVLATTINVNRGTVVNVAQGTLDSFFGTLNVSLSGTSSSQLNINDQNSGGPANGYEVSGTFVRKNNTNQTFNYSGVGRITLNTSSVLDAVNVFGTGAGTALTLNTNAGDDLINVGSGNLDADFGGAITVNGGTGLNDVNVFNGSDPIAEIMTLNGGTLIDGFTHTFSSVDEFRISLGPGGTNMTVNSVIPRTTVTGGSGDDTFTVGGGNIAAGFPQQLAPAPLFNGGGGTDALIIDDRNGLGTGGSYEFERPTGIDRLKRGAAGTWFINWSNMESATLEASDLPTTGTGTADIFVFQSLTPLRINGNGGGDRVFVMDPAHPVIVNTGTGTHDQLEVNFAGGAPSTAIVDGDDEVNGLRINSGGTLRVAEGATLAKSQVSGASNYFEIIGTLDLGDGALLSRAGGPTSATFQTWLTRGFNSGAWNGTHANGAIHSSLAASSAFNDGVGYGLGAQVAPTSIGPFSIAAGDTLLRYALDGDADLSGSVNLSDFNRLAAHFGQSNQAWVDGDANYDGLVNLTDFNTLAGNFGTSVGRQPFDARSGLKVRGNDNGDELRKLLEELS